MATSKENIFHITDFLPQGKFEHIRCSIHSIAPAELFIHVNRYLGIKMCERDVKIEMLKAFSLDAEYNEDFQKIEVKCIPALFTAEKQEAFQRIFHKDLFCEYYMKSTLQFHYLADTLCTDKCVCGFLQEAVQEMPEEVFALIRNIMK